jgi:hypothetical protein
MVKPRTLPILGLILLSSVGCFGQAANLGYDPNYVGTGNGCIAGGTCYYIDWSRGNDSNSGLSKVQAWKHMPGMAGATGRPAAHTVSQTDQFILKGGETWPYAALNNTFGWFIGTGGATTPNAYAYPGVYIGYDPAWNNGTVLSVRVVDPGFCSATARLSVSLTRGGGSGATATAIMDAPQTPLNESPAGTYNPSYSILAFVKVTAAGSGYTSNPDVGFSLTSGSCSKLPRAYADIYSPIISAAGATWGNSKSIKPVIDFRVRRITVDHLEIRDVSVYSNSDYSSSGTATVILNDALEAVWRNIYLHNFTLSSVSGFNAGCIVPGGSPPPCNLDIASTAGIQGGGNINAAYATSLTVTNSIFTNYESVASGCAANSGYKFECVQMTAAYDVGKFTNNIMNYWRGGIYTVQASNAYTVAGNKAWAFLHDVGTQHGDAFYLNGGGITYNNILRNIYPGTAAFYQETNRGAAGTTAIGLQSYFFNNVIWDIGTSTPPIGWSSEFTATATGFSPAPLGVAWNNTYYGYRGEQACNVAGQWYGTSARLQASFSFTLANNHCITNQSKTPWYYSDAGNYGIWNGRSNPNSAGTRALIGPTSVIMSPSSATSQGYVPANNFAPTAASNGSVAFSSGRDTQNLTSTCRTTVNGLSLADLCYDITGKARPTTGGWEAGAYYFGGSRRADPE